MKKQTFAAVAIALAVGGAAAALAQEPVAPAGAGVPRGPELEATKPAGLGDLERTTFACPRAALNAAARQVRSYPTQGMYQFSYFNIASKSHHAAYEVHFTSNVAAEPVLKFCVTIYCQQGFDPATSQTNVTLIGKPASGHAAGAGHPADACRPPRAAATGTR
jgi:hypothetical protein